MADVTEHFADGSEGTAEREWVEEVPVALEFNGLSYAVMMATPRDLEDFALGFAVAEGLASKAADLESVDVAQLEEGWIVRGSLQSVGVAKLQERVRTRVAESSCGLCGIENLQAIAAPLPQVAAHSPVFGAQIIDAQKALRTHQDLGRRTGAAHAAAFVGMHGEIVAVREDVGRHNALDKLVGALLRSGIDPASGFALSSARCSYEIVEKAVRAGITTLATVSLPTSMAVARAEAAGLSLWCLAREDSVLQVCEGNLIS
ncbi:formate dehydrogenase accessory sulfurtransferase FdhD [Qipengyuania atrilutea]|uniref:Sulfur carrier protein FdhD n=1 Tax=Qipengyuania atrilutea TaxID=2744473 RepID=A0A850H5G4_9SPHN|nr:formate dehydrogenase accessory sulfurtransferase FdhD [Actirhodobacter atriluteus]NVD45906.1 formate dehydrogenase accessory sulfurtransferase FdhD [Actirhodobacter atriluteus]